MEAIREQLYNILAANHPMTVRQVFYYMVTRPTPLIAKTENQYKHTVDRLLVQMRRSGEVPFRWIADNTRWMRKPPSYDSMAEALLNTARTYRRDLWTNQDLYVEVWTEKDALAGVLMDVTREWDVPLMVARGFSSVTFLHSAAETIRDIGNNTEPSRGLHHAIVISLTEHTGAYLISASNTSLARTGL
jgi:hypothetical protein